MPYIANDDRKLIDEAVNIMSDAIAKMAAKHGYEAAFAGNLNYALTRLMQELPRSLMKEGVIKEEIRYWIQPLMYGVLMDVVLEHKRRVNVSYEAAQILKSGDCYDTPYYTKLVDMVDENGKVVGQMEVMVKRSLDTVSKDTIGQVRIEK